MFKFNHISTAGLSVAETNKLNPLLQSAIIYLYSKDSRNNKKVGERWKGVPSFFQ